MRASDVTLDWLLPQLEGVEGSGDQYYAYCPVHDDIGSLVKGLSITHNGKRVLCKCHSPQCGATLTQVIAALTGERSNGAESIVNVTKSSQTRKTKGKNGLKNWAEYTQVEESIWKKLGCEEDGDAIAFTFTDTDIRKIRAPGKQIHFEPKGVGISPLWPIPGDDLPEHISITEGESDCGTTYAAGLPMGFSVTKGSDTPMSSETFLALARQGVREITFFADADNAGEELRSRVVQLATEANLSVNVCDLTRIFEPWYPVKDINELWKKADDLTHFLSLIERATYAIAKTRPAMTITELYEEANKEVDWIIPNLLARQDKVLLWGPQKSYKTWIALDLMRTLTTGTPFLKRPEWTPKHPVNTLLVEEEGNTQLFARRIKKLQIEEDNDYLHVMHRKGIKFTDPDSISALIGACRELEIEVLILDPMQRMIPGVDENQANETGVVWDEIQRVQEAIPGLAVCVVHHANKGDGNRWESARGSSRHGGEVDLGLSIQKHDIERNTCNIWMDGREVYADLQPDESFLCKIEITDDSFSADATSVEVRVRKGTHATKAEESAGHILNAIQEGCNTRTKIMHRTNLSDATVRKHLDRLLEKGDIKEDDNGPGKPKNYTPADQDQPDE